MTLLEEIQAAFPDLSNRDDGAIAAALSVGRTKVVSRLGGIGLVMETLGPVAGGQLLDMLEAMSPTNSAVKWALFLIKNGTLDFGAPATRGMIDLLLPPDVAILLKAVAVVPDPVSAQQVAQALEGI